MPYKDRKKFKAYYKEWERRHRLTTTGHKRLLGTKRPYPKYGICELCNKRRQLLDYHHYDDNDLSKGLWLCRLCHPFAEMVDKGFTVAEMVDKGITVANKKLVTRYISLKVEITER